MIIDHENTLIYTKLITLTINDEWIIEFRYEEFCVIFKNCSEFV